MTELNEIAKALNNVQKHTINAEKDGKNPFFKSNYATLESVWHAIRKPLTDNGLSVVQLPNSNEGGCFLTTRLMHTSGQYIESHTPIIMKENSAQALGSAISYARRYALAAMLGVISDEDDDGEGAMARPVAQAPQFNGKGVSDAQLKRLFAISQDRGWAPDEVRELIFKETGKESSKELDRAEYDLICKRLEEG